MKTKTRLAFFLIVLFQMLVLAGLIIGNEIALANGQSVVLQTGPVDPRDIFRGDYVQLRYEISTLRNTPGVYMLQNGDTAYVRLEKSGDVWAAVQVSNQRADADKWAVFIAGEVTRIINLTAVLDYGIEQYFVPEGQGLVIQNAKDLKVRVKLGSSGKAMIENLIVDGQVFQLK